MKESPEADPWFVTYCAQMEKEWGRGWKRRLALKVGVRESNVQVWLRSQRVPAAVRRAIELYDELEKIEHAEDKTKSHYSSRFIAEEKLSNTVFFSVLENDSKTGRLHTIARAIPTLEIAREIAGIPEIKRLIADVINGLNLYDRYSNHPDDIKIVKEIENWPPLTAFENEAEINKIVDENHQGEDNEA